MLRIGCFFLFFCLSCKKEIPSVKVLLDKKDEDSDLMIRSFDETEVKIKSNQVVAFFQSNESSQWKSQVELIGKGILEEKKPLYLEVDDPDQCKKISLRLKVCQDESCEKNHEVLSEQSPSPFWAIPIEQNRFGSLPPNLGRFNADNLDKFQKVFLDAAKEQGILENNALLNGVAILIEDQPVEALKKHEAFTCLWEALREKDDGKTYEFPSYGVDEGSKTAKQFSEHVQNPRDIESEVWRTLESATASLNCPFSQPDFREPLLFDRVKTDDLETHLKNLYRQIEKEQGSSSLHSLTGVDYDDAFLFFLSPSSCVCIEGVIPCNQ